MTVLIVQLQHKKSNEKTKKSLIPLQSAEIICYIQITQTLILFQSSQQSCITVILIGPFIFYPPHPE